MRSFNERNSNLLFGRPLADDDWQHLQKTVLGMAQRFNEFALPVPFPRVRVRYEDFVPTWLRRLQRSGLYWRST